MRWSERGGPPYNNPPYYLSAYGLAVKHGFKGTEEEYLASLKGETGALYLGKVTVCKNAVSIKPPRYGY